jgi:predicted nucleotidyltransferase
MNVSVGDRDIALGNEILRTVVGSGVHGMAIPGTDDNDEMGVYIERPEQVMGLMPTAEHYVSRTQPNGVRSGPGDTDLTIYSLRKFMRLATAGNPSILTLLYAPEDAVLIETDLGQELRRLAPQIVSAKAGWRFLGYLDGQRQRMTGEGHQSRVPNRPELTEKYGYDTKYASHALRLGLQGLELMTQGHLTLPLTGGMLQSCMEVKRGEVAFSEALRRVDSVRERLHSVMKRDAHVLMDGPNTPAINEWMSHAHRIHWAGWW